MLDEHIEVVFADTESARSIHYRMRYQVYCLERGYEDPDAYPEGEERDEWDGDAAHFIVRHRPTGEWLATLRLVLPKAGRLPLNGHCRLPHQIRSRAPVTHAGEISRLCIWPAGRRLAASVPSAGGELLTALLRAALDYSLERGLRYWYFLISPGLARMVRRLCISLTPAGDACELRGRRIPYVADIEDSLRNATDPLLDRLQRMPGYRRYSELFGEVAGDLSADADSRQSDSPLPVAV
jgi:N-acyl-L-homoserine lactone synthetase